MTHTVEIQQIQSQLDQLLSAIQAGDEVVLTQHEKPVARLTPMSGILEDQDKPRIAGLHEGNVLWISNDFDDYLGDEFWLGEL